MVSWPLLLPVVAIFALIKYTDEGQEGPVKRIQSTLYMVDKELALGDVSWLVPDNSAGQRGLTLTLSFHHH